MQAYTSLGQKVSNKISSWILILVASVIMAVFAVSFILSQQMFNKQIDIWNTIAPQQILTNLVDSDHFAIEREVDFLKSTELFSSFAVADNKKKMIAHFAKDNISNENFLPIEDDTKVVWGYYYFKPDFYHFISPFLFAAVIFFLLIMFFYFVIRWRIRASLESEFTKFNKFLTEIESVTERLHEVYNQDNHLSVDLKTSQNSEQIIINKVISRLLNEIKKANNSLREAVSAAEQRRFQEELTRTALQVAHDIASPIAVLGVIESTTVTLPEDSRILIRRAISNIRDISNTLLKKAKKDFSSISNLEKQSLQSLIDQIITEKRAQYGDQAELLFNFDKDAHRIFSQIKSAELSRVLSNIINNSVEAMENDNIIIISLTSSDKEALIQIQDYGKGISPDVLSKLGGLGKSFGKSQGTGVGLNHAIHTINEWGGRFDIKSEEGMGTTVKISLPVCDPPLWFVSEISVLNKKTIVITDDDESIHAVWKKKFEECMDIDLVHFNSPESLIQWHKTNANNNNLLFLCDYEFIGSDMNGIELIKKLKIKHTSILVTNRIVDDVIRQCESEKIKLLPKNLAGVISIVETRNSIAN